jgi:hypothetical protein
MSRIVAAFLAGLMGRPAIASGAELTSPVLGNVVTAGAPLSFTLRAEADTARWRVRDFFGKEVASGNTPISGNSAIIAPRVPGLGYFTLDASLERGGAPAGSAHTALAILPPADKTARDSPFGVVTHFAKDWSTDIIPLIEKAGIGRVRDEQPWRKVEKQPGQYQFPPRLTGYMTELAAHGIDPLIVLAFSNPLYDNDKTPYDQEGRSGYAAYAAAVARRYGKQLSAVEVWNEYNGDFCQGPCREDRPAYYASMLKEAYAKLKVANPSLTVLGGAGVPIPLDYFQGLFKNGALDAMDAIVIHPYRKVPEGVEEKIDDLRQAMQRYGKSKPIWATEFSDFPDMRDNRDNAARYLVRMSTLLLAAKVDRIYWYLLKDYQQFTGLGLVRSESDAMGRYVPTAAYAAYAVLIQQLSGARFVRREPSDPQMRVYLFSRGGTEIRVAWSTASPGAYQLQPGGPIRQIDLMGNARTIPRQTGPVSIPVDQTPIYLISDSRPGAPG